MKIFLLTTLFSTLALANSIDGVEYNCLPAAEKKGSRLENHSLAYSCRDRKEQTKELFTFCDGSGCTGFTMTFKNNRCVVSDQWTGQDDQDMIDPVEYAESCLTADDFNKWVPAPKTKLNSMKVGDRTEIPDSRVYQFMGDSSKASTIEKGEAVGKQLRHEYYKKNYQVDRVLYREVSIREALKLLQTPEGEFKGLSASDIEKIESWVENKSVGKVVQMNLITNYMSGTAVEDNFIFLPTESYDFILVVNRFTYAE